MLVTLLFLLSLILTGLYAFSITAPRVHLGWLGVSVALLALCLSRWPL